MEQLFHIFKTFMCKISCESDCHVCQVFSFWGPYQGLCPWIRFALHPQTHQQFLDLPHNRQWSFKVQTYQNTGNNSQKSLWAVCNVNKGTIIASLNGYITRLYMNCEQVYKRWKWHLHVLCAIIQTYDVPACRHLKYITNWKSLLQQSLTMGHVPSVPWDIAHTSLMMN